MVHNQETPVKSINTSINYFGINNENQFVVLDDAKHFIGFYPNNSGRFYPSSARTLILENVENGLMVKFNGMKSNNKYITTMVFNQETGSLFSGDQDGHLIQHKVDITNKTCKEVKDFGKLGIGAIISFHRFLQFVFFGGNDGKIRVLDLSIGELLSGYIDTSIKYIRSLQVCVKNQNEIYLAVSGSARYPSEDKIDLFDISAFLLKDSVIIPKLYLEHQKNLNQQIFDEQSKIKSEAEIIKNLTQERDSYEAKYNEIQSKYDDLKEKYDHLFKRNTELRKTYETIKIESQTKNQQLQKKISILDDQNTKKQTTIISKKESLIGKRSFNEIDPLVNIKKMRENIQEEKDLKKHYQNTIYDVIGHRIAAEKESRELRIELDTVKSQLTTIHEVVENK